MGMFGVIELYQKCIDDSKLQEAKELIKKKPLPTLAKHIFDFSKSNSKDGTTVTDLKKCSRIDSILGITLDCLKDNIVFCNLNEIYVIRLQYISIDEILQHTIGKPDALHYGLKVLQLLKEKNDTHLLPQTYEVLFALLYDLKFYEEALDMLMESADCSPIDYLWHKRMAECYLYKFQFNEAHNHIQDCQSYGYNVRLFEYDCIIDIYCMNIGDFTNGPLAVAHDDGQNTFEKSLEMTSLYLFKNKRFEDCKARSLSGFIKNRDWKRSILFYLFICCEHLVNQKLLLSQSFLKDLYEDFDGLKVTYLLQNIHQYVFNHVCIRSGQFFELENILFSALKSNHKTLNCTRNALSISQNSCLVSKHFKISITNEND